MVSLIKRGSYRLIETRHQTKILYLDDKTYAWVELLTIGEMLVISRKEHKTDRLLSLGEYRMYSVIDEPRLTDQIHLELECGTGCWQGYLLLTGLPTDVKKRSRIISTQELITGIPEFVAVDRVGALQRS